MYMYICISICICIALAQLRFKAGKEALPALNWELGQGKAMGRPSQGDGKAMAVFCTSRAQRSGYGRHTRMQKNA